MGNLSSKSKVSHNRLHLIALNTKENILFKTHQRRGVNQQIWDKDEKVIRCGSMLSECTLDLSEFVTSIVASPRHFYSEHIRVSGIENLLTSCTSFSSYPSPWLTRFVWWKFPVLFYQRGSLLVQMEQSPTHCLEWQHCWSNKWYRVWNTSETKITRQHMSVFCFLFPMHKTKLIPFLDTNLLVSHTVMFHDQST